MPSQTIKTTCSVRPAAETSQGQSASANRTIEWIRRFTRRYSRRRRKCVKGKCDWSADLQIGPKRFMKKPGMQEEFDLTEFLPSCFPYCFFRREIPEWIRRFTRRYSRRRWKCVKGKCDWSADLQIGAKRFIKKAGMQEEFDLTEFLPSCLPYCLF